jgi:hypothetical protein
VADAWKDETIRSDSPIPISFSSLVQVLKHMVVLPLGRDKTEIVLVEVSNGLRPLTGIEKGRTKCD